MAASPAPLTSATTTEVLALAFARSPVRGAVDTAALEKVAGRVLGRPGTFDLQPVWDLLVTREPFDPRAAAPPFCWLKSQERRLGLSVLLPTALGQMSPHERDAHAALIPVKAHELERVLNPAAPAPVGPSTSQKHPARGGSADLSVPPTRVHTPAQGSRRRGLVVGAAVVAVISVAFIALTLVREYGGRQSWETVRPDDLGPGLPVATARRLGRQLNVRLADPSWFTQPEDARRQQLGDAWARVQGKQIDVLVIEDDEGKMLASAQAMKPTGVKVRFY